MIGGLHVAKCVIVRLVVHNDNRVKSVVHSRQGRERGLLDNWSECVVGQSCMQPRASISFKCDRHPNQNGQFGEGCFHFSLLVGMRLLPFIFLSLYTSFSAFLPFYSSN